MCVGFSVAATSEIRESYLLFQLCTTKTSDCCPALDTVKGKSRRLKPDIKSI